ncbi:MAG: tRNA dihydrouridine(20/20a) synthase DusA [Legionellales bacterium RIFCSPHIGHO2_12_FULL_42_9]|nr:MAG: tRNA dihydrouridine(20/20a) synthase DusA [Legionellales bacterium RIFCSPHIGHO2_12_FULL_42_9]
MIDWTMTHFRVFMRLIAPNALLYTEMQTVGAVEHAPEKALSFNAIEQPLALQLGGSDPKKLADSAKRAEKLGFIEVNLNLGCPSGRVQSGNFGACLMKSPDLVSDCIKAIKDTVTIPVTAKTRIGIDKQDSYDFFANFVQELIDAGCDKLIVHARKAWLHGLNPKQNRTIPPVQYDYVYRIKEQFSEYPVVINGNINTLAEIHEHMQSVDGVMLGRLACQNPYALALIHRYFYPQTMIRPRAEIMTAYLNYAGVQLEQGVHFSLLLKPLFNFAHGMPYSKRWKALLTKAQQTKDFAVLQVAAEVFSES